jgi:hypothetical protein
MKRTFKLLGIIALASVIGFTLAGCENPADGGTTISGGDETPVPDPNPDPNPDPDPDPDEETWDDNWIVDKEATCTEAGERHRVGSLGTVQTDHPEALGHDYGDPVVTPATIYADGSAVYTCTRGDCGHQRTDVLTRLPFDWNHNMPNYNEPNHPSVVDVDIASETVQLPSPSVEDRANARLRAQYESFPSITDGFSDQVNTLIDYIEAAIDELNELDAGFANIGEPPTSDARSKIHQRKMYLGGLQLQEEYFRDNLMITNNTPFTETDLNNVATTMENVMKNTIINSNVVVRFNQNKTADINLFKEYMDTYRVVCRWRNNFNEGVGILILEAIQSIVAADPNPPAGLSASISENYYNLDVIVPILETKMKELMASGGGQVADVLFTALLSQIADVAEFKGWVSMADSKGLLSPDVEQWILDHTNNQTQGMGF